MAMVRPTTEELLIGLGHPLQVPSPPGFRSLGLGDPRRQILLGVRLEGVATTFRAKPVTMPLTNL